MSNESRDRILSLIKKPSLAQLAEAAVLRPAKSEFESLKRDHPLYKPSTWKIYGPYLRNDLRMHVIAYDGNKKITISYPKFIIECKLKRILADNEDVHHKDEREYNNHISNFEIIDSSTHRSQHSKSDGETFSCPKCHKIFTLDGKKLSDFWRNKNMRPKMSGPYCSKSCAGYAGK